MRKTLNLIVVNLIATGLVGCSYLESYFPDKERDYQYTTELPMLDWPVELRKNTSPNPDNETFSNKQNNDSHNSERQEDNASFWDNKTDASKQVFESEQPPVATATDTENPPVDPANASDTEKPVEIRSSETDDRNTVSSVDIVTYDDGESRLRVGAGFSKSWRVVSKALSRNQIEVTDRNHEQGLIALQYDPNETKIKDDSIMDEFLFFLHGINNDDQEFKLKLEEHNGSTDVIVLSEDMLPMLKNDSALRLLKKLAATIQADVVDKNPE
jgi:outer membrane protein assembly factor BamC